MIKASKDFMNTIKGLLASAGAKYGDFAGYLGINRQSLANKIQRGSLSAIELIELCNFLNFDISITDKNGNKTNLNNLVLHENEKAGD